MSEAKTVPTGADVSAYLQSIPHKGRREDAIWLDQLFQEVTGFAPLMWGPSIVGYGRYQYTYDSGRSGSFLATGFAPRKTNMVLYIMPGYADFGDILTRLGPHKMGKSCLYLGRLNKIDAEALGDLIRAGLADLDQRWPVLPG